MLTFVVMSLVALAAGIQGLSIPETTGAKRAAYPFNRLVAFGDDLSDNGNGSYAHGITGGDSNNYGFGTWTDGPVAVSYLADMLGVPLDDYAMGGCCGGAALGATINNTYTPSGALYDGKPVASVHDQIFYNYTLARTPKDIKNAMQFIWVGQTDLSDKTDAFWEGDPENAFFASNISDRIRYNAEHLIKQGAPYVFVANIYPKHRAPVTTTFMCSDGSCVDGWGKVIETANSGIETALKKSKYASQLIYYDVYGFMTHVMDNMNSYGLTQPLTDFCDGDENAKWDQCAAGSYTWEGATKFYWMTFTQPTTTVHRFIAADMKKRIDSFLDL